MESPLPPDPYLALGVPKDATAAAVKAAHRKLVLKCHPDKVSDPNAKQAAADQFHKIQTSYEILVDQDRRERYDAQVRLAELRKEKLERQGSGGPRGERPGPSAYKSSQESVPRPAYGYWDSERGPVPQTEERVPAYAREYDSPPRASTRKEPEYERPQRRSAQDTSKQKSRPSARDAKDTERERRKEKSRKMERETQRERDQKYRAIVEDESESTSDEYERRSRRMREEDDAAAARRMRDAHWEKAARQHREAEKGGYYDERTRKMYAASADAWDYIRSSGRRDKSQPERRPSPVRQGSSKDKFEYVKRKDGRPSVVSRRPSERPRTTTRDAETSRRRSRDPEREVRLSAENAEDVRKPPTLSQSQSSPADIRIPAAKPRAQSVQVEAEAPEILRVKRSETMPYDTQHRSENVAPSRTANLRNTEVNEGLATPGATPEYTSQPAVNSTKYRYGRQQQYADDMEFATPDGYRTSANDSYLTEVREPAAGNVRPTFTRKVTRSPSPIKEYRDPREVREPRDKPRSASTRYATSTRAPSPGTRATSYMYAPGQGVETRQNGVRNATPQALYGEVPHAADFSRPKYGSPYLAPDESSRYQHPSRPEDIRVQSGYGYIKRSSNDRPSTSRAGSGNPIYTSVRAA